MTSTPTVVRPRRFGVTVFVALLVVVVDQSTKAVIVATMPGKLPIQVIGEWLQITFVLNPGAAFGLGTGMTVLFSAIAIGVVVVILRVAQRLRSVAWAIALGGILGGAVGNLLDRLFRAPGPLRGHVVDWIEVPHWPVFNIADSAIVLSAVLMVVLSVRGIGLDGVRAGTASGPVAGGSSGTS